MSKGLRVNHLSKCIIIRVMESYGLRATCYCWGYKKGLWRIKFKGKPFWTMLVIKRRKKKLRLKG